jgi:glycerophosphoryl diester phosphodiesterase
MSGLDWLVARPIAHRGLHDKANGIVENTITAADAAIARGLSIECDVQLTADDDAVVFHDFALDRLTAQAGEVATRTSTDLQAIAIEGSRSDRIPSLGSFLARIDGRVPLVVEIKSRFDGNMTLTKRTCDLLSGYGGPVVVKSFDPAVIATVRRIAPQIVRGIVAEASYAGRGYDRLSESDRQVLTNFLHYEESQPQFLSWNVKDLPAPTPYLCRALGHMPVMSWTVRTPEDRLRAAKFADQMVFEGFLP